MMLADVVLYEPVVVRHDLRVGSRAIDRGGDTARGILESPCQLRQGRFHLGQLGAQGSLALSRRSAERSGVVDWVRVVGQLFARLLGDPRRRPAQLRDFGAQYG